MIRFLIFFYYLSGTYEYIGCSLYTPSFHVFVAGSSLTEAIAQMCVSNVCIPGANKQLWGTDWFVASNNGMTIERCTGFCAANNFLLASIDAGYILRIFKNEIKSKFKIKIIFVFGF